MKSTFWLSLFSFFLTVWVYDGVFTGCRQTCVPNGRHHGKKKQTRMNVTEVKLLFSVNLSNRSCFICVGLQVVHQERVTLESQLELLRPLASTWRGSLGPVRGHGAGLAPKCISLDFGWEAEDCFSYKRDVNLKGLRHFRSKNELLTWQAGIIL